MNKKKIIIAAAAVIIAAAAIIAVVFTSSAPDKNNSGKNPSSSQSTAPSENAPEQATPGQSPSESTQKSDTEAPAKTEAPAAGSSTEKQTAEPEEKVAPTFMYFVNDELEKETEAMITELKKEHPEVVFDIKNVDKDPELLKNFSLVDGKLPSLIMLDTSNNICGFEFSCTDKSKLEENIKKALGN
ncbi:MAG: hypothetical protein J6N52_11235 [Clostridia bacterium]|nr:hypothetical protein [Clostridia bacterium]